MISGSGTSIADTTPSHPSDRTGPIPSTTTPCPNSVNSFVFESFAFDENSREHLTLSVRHVQFNKGSAHRASTEASRTSTFPTTDFC